MMPGMKKASIGEIKVVWQHAEIDSPRYQSGWEFTKLPENILQEIEVASQN